MDAITVEYERNGDATVYVYGLKRLTLEHTPDGFECSLWRGDEVVSWVATSEDDEVREDGRWTLTDKGVAALG